MVRFFRPADVVVAFALGATCANAFSLSGPTSFMGALTDHHSQWTPTFPTTHTATRPFSERKERNTFGARENANTITMQMMGGRKGGEDRARHDNSGDDDDKLRGVGGGMGSIWVGSKANGKEKSDSLVVSDVVLLWLWLERRLEEEIRHENFHEAALIKREMSQVHDKALDILEHKINEAADAMREETSKKRRDRLARMQMDMEQALAEEDYERAGQVQQELEGELKKRESSVSPSKIWKKIDSVWLDGEINNKIQQLRAREEKLLEDPIARLQQEIRSAVEDEDFARAAIAKVKLLEEEHKRDLEKMEKSLSRECAFRKMELDKLKEDPLAFLACKLQDEVNAEDYEAAYETSLLLARNNFETVISDITNRTMQARLAFERLDQVSKLEAEQDKAVTEEDYERAKEIREKIMEVNSIRRLQWSLNKAVESEDFEEAASLKRELLEAYTSSLSPAVLNDLGYTYRSPLFKVGDVVEHVESGYRGVVVGWHDTCRASQDWVENAGVDQWEGGRKQRFYHILPDTRQMQLSSLEGKPASSPEHRPAFLCGMSSNDAHPLAVTTYVAESRLRRWDFKRPVERGFFASMLRSVLPESPVSHPLVSAFFFSYSRGRYLHGGKVRGVVFYHFDE